MNHYSWTKKRTRYAAPTIIDSAVKLTRRLFNSDNGSVSKVRETVSKFDDAGKAHTISPQESSWVEDFTTHVNHLFLRWRLRVFACQPTILLAQFFKFLFYVAEPPDLTAKSK